jgi:hypothetical protein
MEMSDHISDVIADYLEDRLDSERRRAFEAHVKECAQCADDFRWAREFVDAATLQGLRHVPAERIIEIADGRGEVRTDVEERHFETCAACRKEIAWAREAAERETVTRVEAGEIERGADPQARSRGLWRWRWPLIPGAGVLAAAAALLLLFVLPGRDDHGLRELALIEPIPVRITRGPVDPGGFEESRVRGLEAYQAGDYAGAREALRRAAELEGSDAEVALYLGSVELLLGDTGKAVELFERSAATAPSDVVRDEAYWQLANAELARGRAREATAILEDLSGRQGPRRSNAATLLSSLEAARR